MPELLANFHALPPEDKQCHPLLGRLGNGGHGANGRIMPPSLALPPLV